LQTARGVPAEGGPVRYHPTAMPEVREPRDESELMQRLHALREEGGELLRAASVDEVGRLAIGRTLRTLPDALSGVLVLRRGEELMLLAAGGLAADVERRWRRFPLDSEVAIARAVRTGEPGWYATADEYPSVERGRWPEVRALVSLPLRAGGEIVGGLGVTFSRPQRFDAVYRHALLTVARHTGEALHRVRLLEDRDAALGRARHLQQVATDLARALRPEDVARIAVVHGMNELGAKLGWLGRLSVDGAHLEMLHGAGESPDELQRAARVAVAGSTVAARALREGQPQWVESPADLQALGTVLYPLEGSRLLLPLQADQQLLGVVGFACSSWRHFGDDERAFVLALAGQTALALDRAGLFERVTSAEAESRRIAERQELLAAAAHEFSEAALDAGALHERVEQVIGRVLAGSARVSEELPAARPAGPYLEALLRARGERIGAVRVERRADGAAFTPEEAAMLRDLAERAAMVLHTARQFQLAQEAVQLRDDFLSVAGHELRTPLTTLTLQLQLLRAGKGSEVDRRLDRALSMTRKLKLLIEELLDVARLRSGRMTLAREPLDLAELASAVVDDAREAANRAGIELQLEALPVHGSWDRLRVQQVLVNLVENAIKYGLGRPVRVQVRPAPGGARVDVVDRGIGIAPEDRERIFERFERASSTRAIAGLGLGLWITRQVVRAHGGTVHAEGEPGGGSRFVVELPGSA
jgi:signal transduction histidine kinase/transcriptional regulator with GAF, ATPase, and Fis domain